jgi:histidinol-phosphate/aromatic aminotransferase/cobyric acid decarboxylase-like protein
MVEFLHRAREMELVIVDESFIDFAGDPIPSLLPIADQFTNLLIVRSMSKHCGVPGLRLGYCYSAISTSSTACAASFPPGI